jgi:hypothetical protein
LKQAPWYALAASIGRVASAQAVPWSSDDPLLMPLLSCPVRELYAAGCINHRIDHQLKTCLLADNAGQRQVVGGGIFDPMAFTSRVPSNFEAGQDQVIDEDLEESALFNLCRPYQSLELIGPRVASKSPLCGAPD